MIPRQPTFFDSTRLRLDQALELTAEILRQWGALYRHWALAYSGGKDSSALLAAVVYLIDTGRVPRPITLTVLYADTRMELPPLHATAMKILAELEARGVQVRIVLPAMEDRFFVYMLGRGVPPPSNTFRWCTAQLKIEPMLAALCETAIQYGMGSMVIDEKTGKLVYRGFGDEKLMMLTGVRVGESAARDARIAVSCGKNGAECGQGWLQETTPTAIADTLAPILHWRVCHVWDWLTFNAVDHGFSTQLVASAYGGDEAQEINARTGCIACNLASKDLALETILEIEEWKRLRPLLELRALYAELKKPANRLRKDGRETREDGSLVSNPCRMGPLTFEARRWALGRVADIQERAGVDLINAEERAKIVELIDAETWPRGWDGTEPLASLPFENVNPDGSVQPLLI